MCNRRSFAHLGMLFAVSKVNSFRLVSTTSSPGAVCASRPNEKDVLGMNLKGCPKESTAGSNGTALLPNEASSSRAIARTLRPADWAAKLGPLIMLLGFQSVGWRTDAGFDILETGGVRVEAC